MVTTIICSNNNNYYGYVYINNYCYRVLVNPYDSGINSPSN